MIHLHTKLKLSKHIFIPYITINTSEKSDRQEPHFPNQNSLYNVTFHLMHSERTHFYKYIVCVSVVYFKVVYNVPMSLLS